MSVAAGYSKINKEMVLDNLKKYRIILASNSPRRKELLGGLGIDYEVKVLCLLYTSDAADEL